MMQTTITPCIKTEIDIDWDETDNRYGESLDDDAQETKHMARDVLEGLSEPVLQKYIGVENSFPADKRSGYTGGRFARVCQKCKKNSELICPTKCESCFSKLLYHCNKCSKQFKTSSLAKYHWTTRCGVKGYFTCGKCDYKSALKCIVVKHMKQSHQLSKTSEEFSNIKWIGLNQRNVKAEVSPYECSKCSKIMENDEQISQHIQICGVKNCGTTLKGSKRSIQVELNKCSSCGQEFDHIHSLDRHRTWCKKILLATKVTNSDVKVFPTDEDLLFKSPFSVDKQRLARIREMIVKYCGICHDESAIGEHRGIRLKELCHKCKITLLFKCKKCFKTYSNYGYLTVHLKIICDPQEAFKCFKCDYIASSLQYVKRHYLLVHGIDCKVDCKICKKNFKSSFYLNRHMRLCGVEAEFQCEHCPYKSKQKVHLERHIFRSHMEPVVIDRRESIKMSCQRFSQALKHLTAHCSKCQKVQPLGYRLKNCQICETTLSYECNICKKKSADEDENACEHVKGYLEAIIFECKHCGRGVISKDSLRSHERRYCRYASKQKGNTVKHEKEKHPHEV